MQRQNQRASTGRPCTRKKLRTPNNPQKFEDNDRTSAVRYEMNAARTAHYGVANSVINLNLPLTENNSDLQTPKKHY